MKSSLKMLTINVTEICDASCIYCNWGQRSTASEPFDTLAKAVSDAASMGASVIRISGGEPILYSELPLLIAHIRENKLISMVCTACKHGMDTLVPLINAGLDVLSVSIDTVWPKLFRKIRGYDIEPILENIENLAKKRAEDGFELVLSVVLTRLSVDGLLDVLEYARSHDLVVNITPYQSVSAGSGQAEDALAFKKEDEVVLLNAIRIAKEAADSGIRVVNADSYLDGIADFMINHELPNGYSCNAGESSIIRLVGGKFKLCHSLKDIEGDDLASVWSSKAAKKQRKQIARLDCPGCWLSCHADTRRSVAHRYGRPEIWDALRGNYERNV